MCISTPEEEKLLLHSFSLCYHRRDSKSIFAHVLVKITVLKGVAVIACAIKKRHLMQLLPNPFDGNGKLGYNSYNYGDSYGDATGTQNDDKVTITKTKTKTNDSTSVYEQHQLFRAM